jgi:hypothetical protein
MKTVKTNSVNQAKQFQEEAKGVKKRYVSKNMQHDMYLRTLRSRTITRVTYRQFRSRVHKIETVDCCKVALCAYKDKRYVLQDGISMKAYAHVMLSNK